MTCDTSRVAVAIAKQRMLEATYDYYKLVDEEEGIGSGMVYKTVPHVMLSDIANCQQIGPISKAHSPSIEPAISRLNKVAKTKFGLSNLPSEIETDWGSEAKKYYAELTKKLAVMRQEIWQVVARQCTHESQV